MTRSAFSLIAALYLATSSVAAASPQSPPPLAESSQTVPASLNDADLRAALLRQSNHDIVRNPRPVVAALPALIARAARDPSFTYAELVAARHRLAYARTYDNDHAGGIADLDALAAELRQRGASGPLLSDTLRRKAVVLSALKRFDDAAAIFSAILADEERAGRAASALTSATLNGLAAVRARQGKYPEAEALARRATAIGRAVADARPLDVGDAWRTWVTLLDLLGRSQEAIIEAQNSLRYNERHQGEASESTVGAMNTLSAALNKVGRYVEAEAVQRRIIAIEERQTTTQGQTMSLYLGNFGSTLAAQGKAVEAEVVLARARALMLKVKNMQRPDFLGNLTINLGKAVEAQGRTDEALALFREALAELTRDTGTDHPVWARAQGEIGRVLLDGGKTTEAIGHLQLARAVMHKHLDPTDGLRMTVDLVSAEAQLRSGDAQGYAAAKAAIDVERAELINAALDPLRSALKARERAGNFTRFAQLALERGAVADAFEAVQLAQFGDLDNAGSSWMARQAAATPALAGLTAELQAAAAQLKRLQVDRTKAVVVGEDSAVTRADADIAAARARAAALTARLNIDYPDYARLARPEPRPLADVQAALAPDAALLVTTPTSSGNVISILVARSDARGVTVALPPRALFGWTTRLRDSIDAALSNPASSTYDGDAAYRLFAAMLPPSLDREARRARTLLVQAGGVLASVPLAALLTRPGVGVLRGAALHDAAWLVRRQALARPISLATLGARATPRRPTRFAAIGAPTLKGLATAQPAAAVFAGLVRAAVGGADVVTDLPSLPAAERELRAIAGALGEQAPLMLVGDAATKANLFAADLTRYNVIAFATHGLVSGELRNLTEPALVMTPGGVGSPGDSGLLTASEVAQLRLDADWVILSACNTSAGEGGAAPIYTGLARAFVQAGARSLLLSHWPLRDDVAASLTVATVEMATQGLPRAEALRRAQLALITNRKIQGAAHPALWAPLTLIGD